MPQEKPPPIPFREPIREFQTPVPSVVFYTELVDRLDIAYQQVAPIKRGTLYSTILNAKQDVINQYANLYFVKETAVPKSDRYVIWTWATVPDAEDTYNSEVTYLAEAVAYPAFARVYTVRRDCYDQFPALDVGSTLTGLVAINVETKGEGYKATDTIDITSPVGGRCAAASLVIDPDGKVISVVITDEGWGYTEPPDIVVVTGTGQGANLTGIVQPQNAYLISQKKQEFTEDHSLRNEFVKVIRIYQTLPGPTLYSTQIDEDGVVINVATTQKVATTITSGETLINGVWTKTTKKQSDNYFTGEETVESRTIPGNPMPTTRLDEDGIEVDVVVTFKDKTLVTTHETLGGTWVKTHAATCSSSMGVSDLVVNEVVESRVIPGNPLYTTRIDEDGLPITVKTTLKGTSTIVSQETLIVGVWTKTYKKEVSDLVAQEIVESRSVPGNPIPYAKLDDDGTEIDYVKTLKDQSTINIGELISGGVWMQTTQESVSDLVSWEVIRAEEVDGLTAPSAKVDSDYEIATTSRVLRDTSLITPSATESGGVITTVDKEQLTSKVSHQATTLKPWLDAASFTRSIPDIIPEEFRAAVTTTVESHIRAGTASMQALGTGEFEHSQRQVNKLLYEDRVTKIGDISFPVIVTGSENTESFGGGVLDVVMTLDDDPLTDDTGLTVVSSKVDPLGNGLYFKTTRQLQDATWPILYGTHIDPTYDIEIDIQKQTVAAGTTGGVLGDGTIVEVKPHDKWRSIQISSKFNSSTLPEDVQWFSGQQHSFPPELQAGAVIDWAEATCNCSDSFSAVLIANMNQYSGPVKTRITEQFYDGTPPDDVTITQFFPQAHNFGFAWASACGTTDGNCRTKSGAPKFTIPLCLHDDLTLTIGAITFTFAATSPASLPHGSYIMLPPRVERRGFGVFRRILTEVLVP